MPVSITLQPPATGFGPGIALNVHTDLVGPIPSGAQWTLTLFSDTDQLHVLGQGFAGQNDHDRLFRPYTSDFQTTWIVAGTSTLTEQARPTLRAELRSSTNVLLDTGTTTFPVVDTTGGLGTQVLLAPQANIQGGFTAQDRTNLNTTTQHTTTMDTNWQQYETVTLPSLQDVLNNITTSVTAVVGAGATAVSQTIGELFSLKPFTSLIQQDLSGGETCENLDIDLSLTSFYGLELIITNYPDDWKFTTPDHQWGHRDLAVLELTLGGVLLLRHGIHTLSHSVKPLPTYPLPWLFFVPTALQPAGLHVRVYWEAGVCGRLIGETLP